MSASKFQAPSIELPDTCLKYNESGSVIGFIYPRVAAFLVEGPFAVCRIDGRPAVRDLQTGLYHLGESKVRGAIRACSEGIRRSDVDEVMSCLNDIGYPECEPSPPTLIPFADGTMDINRYAAGDPDYMLAYDDVRITWQLPHRFDPKARCGEVDDFLYVLSCGNPGVRTNLVETMALALFGSPGSFQTASFLYGPTAANGKSTYMSVMEAVVGRDNAVRALPDDLIDTFMPAEIAGKKLILMNDVPLSGWKHSVSSALKNLIDGEAKMTSRKYEQKSRHANRGLVVMSSNDLPDFPSSDKTGLIRRLHFIPMEARFSAGDTRTDRDILSKVTTAEACRYWLLLAVDALVGIIANNGMTDTPENRALASKTAASNDSVDAWIEDRSVGIGEVAGMPTQEVYNGYHIWCKSCNFDPVNKAVFSRRMATAFGVLSKTKSRGGKNYRYYILEAEPGSSGQAQNTQEDDTQEREGQ